MITYFGIVIYLSAAAFGASIRNPIKFVKIQNDITTNNEVNYREYIGQTFETKISEIEFKNEAELKREKYETNVNGLREKWVDASSHEVEPKIDAATPKTDVKYVNRQGQHLAVKLSDKRPNWNEITQGIYKQEHEPQDNRNIAKFDWNNIIQEIYQAAHIPRDKRNDDDYEYEPIMEVCPINQTLDYNNGKFECVSEDSIDLGNRMIWRTDELRNCLGRRMRLPYGKRICV